jgi:methylenetetrahydrofolate dehydrogenase (NADP+)/methenyltetrahydrofolate cyclohydrolase
MLLHREATPSMAHVRTGEEHLADLLRGADLVISAAGVPGRIVPEMLRPGAILVDVGITVTPSGLVGDFDPRCGEAAKAWTPVPGGVGPVTVSILLANLLLCASARRGRDLHLPSAALLRRE